MTLLLDDQPASRAEDKLRFDRLITAIDSEILARTSREPFVVGIFGRWGSGKSSLLGMLRESLRSRRLPFRIDGQLARQRPSFRDPQWLPRWAMQWFRWYPCNSPRYTPIDYPGWIVVDFSPWIYRQEKSLLIPLLANLAKQQPVIEKLVKAIVKSGPDLIKTVGDMGSEFAKNYGIPLLGFLQSLNTKGSEARDLVEQIKESVETITGNGRKIAFLIDDLDRCHDPAQIVGLLEQIKLFLHLPNCLFFIAADRDQIIKAIESQFPGEGTRYLEKFVQLAIHLPQPESQELVNLLPEETSAGDRQLFARMSEALGSNPRKLKALWNRAHLGLRLMAGDEDRAYQLGHEPSLPLMVRWLLLQDAGLFQANPYSYLDAELILKNGNRLQQTTRRAFREKLGLGRTANAGRGDKPGSGDLEAAVARLEIYLWNDESRFENPRKLSWYAKAAGTPFPQTRSWLEQSYFQGRTDFAKLTFVDEDFSNVRLYGVNLEGAEFWDCDFSAADLTQSNLSRANFNNCDMDRACLNGCGLKGINFDRYCDGLDNLNVDPVTYEYLLDIILTFDEDSSDDNPT